MASHSVSFDSRVHPRVSTRGTLRIVPDVEREADLLGAVFLEPSLDFDRLFDRRAADDDAIDAIAQQVVDHGRGADTAAHLDVQRLLRGEAHDDAAVGEPAVLAPSRSTTCSQFAPSAR